MNGNQKPIFNLEDTDLGMYCIVGIVLVFVVAIVVGAERIPDWASLLTFGATAIGLIATISVAKLKVNQAKPETPVEPTAITPKKTPSKKRPTTTAAGRSTGSPPA